jgi:hypothetical protein
MLALAALPAAAQLKLPRVSQGSTLTQTIGLTEVTIKYSRPGVKGRKIWGALVPYGKVWRTGANEATSISFSDDVTINGKDLPKGTYSLHTIPNESEWTIIFNKTADQWGSYSYDEKQDAIRVTAKPMRSEHAHEWLTFQVPEVSTDSATFEIAWENVVVPFTVNAHTTQRVMSAATAAIAAAKPDDYQTAFSAANFAFENKLDADAAKWLDASMKTKETMGNTWLKARMLAHAGKTAEAIKTGERALSLKTEKDSQALADNIAAAIADWKK